MYFLENSWARSAVQGAYYDVSDWVVYRMIRAYWLCDVTQTLVSNKNCYDLVRFLIKRFKAISFPFKRIS